MDVFLKKTNYESIDQTIKFILDNSGLIFKKNYKVVLKTNGLSAFPKEKGICTDPALIKSVIKYLEELNLDLDIYIGDNPATKDINLVYEVNGTFDAIKNTSCKLINPLNKTKISCNDYKYYSEFEVSKDFIDCDILINLPKLKTHGFAYFTGAIKNYFGLIYGLEKASWHVKASNPYQFGEAICDLYSSILCSFKDKQIFNIMDGILALEGEGPSTSGNPIYLNTIIASKDALSLDMVAILVGHLNFEKSFINVFAKNRNLGVADLNKINIIGDSLDDFNIKMKEPKKAFNIASLNFLNKYPMIKNFVLEHPLFTDKCIKCKECLKICPPNAIYFKNNKMYGNKNKCIRCWCCMEVCPVSAIKKSKRPLIGKIVIKK